MRHYIPETMPLPQYGIGDLVKMIYNDAKCIYIGRHITQIPMMQSGHIVNKEVAIHRVIDLRDSTNPIDCEDFEIKPYMMAKYTEVQNGTKPETE